MATSVTADSSIDELDLPMRVYSNLRRNEIRTVAQVLEMSDSDVLRIRNLGPGSLRDLDAALARHGLTRQPIEPDPISGARPPRPLGTPGVGLERARWLGHQLDVLSEDDRAAPRNALGTRYTGEMDTVAKRRYAWGMYRWAASGEERMPNLQKSGDGYNAYTLPGSVELHLEGLNRLAHEELGDE